MDLNQDSALDFKSDFGSMLEVSYPVRPDSKLSRVKDAEVRPNSKLSYGNDRADRVSRLFDFLDDLKKPRKYSYLVLAIISMVIVTDMSSR